MAKQTFTAGQVLTAAEMNSLQENDYNWTVTTKTASYTLAAGDEGTRIVMNNAGATTITVDDAVFAAGDVVWLHNIGAGTCTITAGTATVSTVGDLALEQYAGGHLYFTSASAAIFFPTEQGGGGKILQVVSTTKTDTFSASVAKATTTAITGLSASITPSSATSKILVMGQVNCASDGTAGEAPVTVLTRGGTAICVGDADGSRSRATSSSGLTSVTAGVDNKEGPYSVGILFLDSPSTTSATTYAVELGSTFFGTQTVYCNRAANALDRDDVWRTTSTLTVMEVSA